MSQSALQAHPSPGGRLATLQTSIEVEDEAELRCEWDPVIPFPAARFSQRIAINLAGSAVLYWSDALMAGRASPLNPFSPLPAIVVMMPFDAIFRTR